MPERARLVCLRLSLLSVVAVATLGAGRWLARMVELDWPLTVRPHLTLVASAVLLVGALAALRGRTWGLLLVLATSASFVGVYLAGVAPPGFLLVPVPGLLAFALVAPALYRRDRAALGAALALAAALGAATAALAGPGLDLARGLLGGA